MASVTDSTSDRAASAPTGSDSGSGSGSGSDSVIVATTVASVPADEAKPGMDMMDDGPSIILFVGLTIAVSLVAVAVFPRVLRRLDLRRAVPALAITGPILALVGGLIGTTAMTLSGREMWYSLLVALTAAAAAGLVGLRLAVPVARDLERIGSTVVEVSEGRRDLTTSIDRTDEVGALAAAVDDLVQSLAAAEEERRIAEEERTAVVGALSHDLRTPLASLLVSIEAVEDGIGDPAVHLKAMRGNVMALERLVEDLFLLARADSGALELQFETLDLAELVDEAVEAVRPVGQQQSVSIVNSMTEPVLVMGDHTALGRVFRNLLDNAVRHSPTGGTITVGVLDPDADHFDRADPIDSSSRAAEMAEMSVASETAESVGTARPVVRLAVVDEGDGFAADFVPRALDRFSQADASRTRRGAAGLGLAIADTLLKAHQGDVMVRPGPGGRVDVDLPLIAEPMPAGG
jgi:two-component system sensor histidine kinase BaeS